MTMSSSSLYEPEQDEEDSEAFDSDAQLKHSKSDIPVSSSSPAIQGLRLSSSSERDDDIDNQDAKISGGRRLEAVEYLRGRLAGKSIEAYTQILEEIVSDVTPGAVPVSGASHRSTRDGIVTWTAKEKEVLFNLLDRKGKNGIKEIADAIGSKSELEVLDYLKLLHKGLERQHLLNRHSRAIVLGDVPAAAEISKECCEALDEYAELLRLQEQTSADVTGRQKHKDFWLVAAEKAEEVDERIQTQDGSILLPDSNIFLSASLLNLPKWIRLSERFFMNFGGSRLEDNWVNVAFEDETPSVTADAFADFYTLTVSITRRLVQSCLFTAMSRIRNMRETGHRKAQVVRTRDVKTAIDVLNMKHDSSDFWTGLARRCSLDVGDVRHRKGWKPRYLDHDEVEAMLSGKSSLKRSRTVSDDRERSVSRPRSESRVDDETTDSELIDNGDDAASQSDGHIHTSPLPLDNGPTTTNEEEQKQSDLEDSHADTIDQKANYVEEKQLWNLLERQPPPSLQAPVKLEDDEDNKTVVTRKPIGERKTRQELVDWRDITLYRSEWEAYGHEIFEIDDEIVENRRKRRRIEKWSVAAVGASRDGSVDRDGGGGGGDSHESETGSASASDSDADTGVHSEGVKNEKPVMMESGDEANPVYQDDEQDMDVDEPDESNVEAEDEDEDQSGQNTEAGTEAGEEADLQSQHSKHLDQHYEAEKGLKQKLIYSGSDSEYPW